MQYLKNYIDGELTGPLAGQHIQNFNPATGEVYSCIPDSDEKDVELAVHAAEKAFPSWSVMAASERSKILMRIADFIERDLDKLALAESIDNGKTVTLARRLDIPRAASNFYFFATAIL